MESVPIYFPVRFARFGEEDETERVIWDPLAPTKNEHLSS